MTIVAHFFPNATDDRLEKIAKLFDQAYAVLSANGISIPSSAPSIYPSGKHLPPEAVNDIISLAMIAVARLATEDPRVAGELPPQLVRDLRSEYIDCF